MQQQPRTRNSVLWWLAPIALLLVLEPPLILLLGRFLLPFLVLVGAAVCISHWSRTALRGDQDALSERFTQEEGEHRRRLEELRSQAEQMEVTLRDLRDLQFTPEQTTRARWAEVDLEEALHRTNEEMAHERGSLYSLEGVRWFGKLEPLLKDLHRMDEPEITRWLGKLDSIRTQGVGILTRLRTDGEAVESRPGAAALRLLEETLGEIEVLRGDLVTRRAEILARKRLGLPERSHEPATRRLLRQGPQAEGAATPAEREASLNRLRARLYEVRAHREVSAWAMEEDDEQENCS